MLLFKTNITQSDENVAEKIYALVVKMIDVLGLKGWFVHHNRTDGNIEVFLIGEDRLPADLTSKLATINAEYDTPKILSVQHLPLNDAIDFLKQAQPFSTVMRAPINNAAGLDELQTNILHRYIQKHAANLRLHIAVALAIPKPHHLSEVSALEQPAWMITVQQCEAEMQEKLAQCIQAESIQALGLPDTLYPFDKSVFRNLPVRATAQDGKPRSFEIEFIVDQPNFEKVYAPFVKQHTQSPNDPFAESRSPAASMRMSSSVFDRAASMDFHGHGAAAAQKQVNLLEIVTTQLIANLKEQLWSCIALQPEIPAEGITVTVFYQRNSLGTITEFSIKYEGISDAKIDIQQARCALADALDVTELTNSVTVHSFNVINVGVQMPKVMLPAIYHIADNQYRIRQPYLSYLVQDEECLTQAFSGCVIEVNCCYAQHPTEPNTLTYTGELATTTSQQPISNPGQQNLYKCLARFVRAQQAKVAEWEDFKQACVDGRAVVTLIRIQDGFNIMLIIAPAAQNVAARDDVPQASLLS